MNFPFSLVSAASLMVCLTLEMRQQMRMSHFTHVYVPVVYVLLELTEYTTRGTIVIDGRFYLVSKSKSSLSVSSQSIYIQDQL